LQKERRKEGRKEGKKEGREGRRKEKGKNWIDINMAYRFGLQSLPLVSERDCEELGLLNIDTPIIYK
jgi:hypothetical protein